ncbi:MAG: 3-methyl-2-oxobutanoate hydroxymethyltransferase [Verrucomicrobiia bacterium]
MSVNLSRKKITTATIRAMKGREKIVSLTAYDYVTAKLLDEADVHLILVGDSLGMVVLGYESTLPVTMADMLHHTAAVARSKPKALLIADMPFMSYHRSEDQAVMNAGRFVQEAGAEGVKVEGGSPRMAEKIKAIIEAGIPVFGHIGLTPQSVLEFGGYKIQGKTDETAKRLLDEAKRVEDAGAFAIVLECVPAELAKSITESIRIPTIGIGAGPHCDGQIQVINDMLGLATWPTFKHVKRFASVGDAMRTAIVSYRDEVRSGKFPTAEQSF